MKKKDIAIFWFRRDLRLKDNAGLYYALKSGFTVVPIFIFDTNILNDLTNKEDKRVTFIYKQIESLKKELQQLGSDLRVFYSTPIKVYEGLFNDFNIKAVYTNHDYEPYAKLRDAEIEKLLLSKACVFNTSKDQVIFEKGEILKDDNLPYTVFTPYSKKWKAKLKSFYYRPYPTKKYFYAFEKLTPEELIPINKLGFKLTYVNFQDASFNIEVIRNYDKNRDIPSIAGTSKLSIHLRFGTISIRQLVAAALKYNEKYLNELIWRDFYQTILWHFPYVVSGSFKKEYDRIMWRNKDEEFNAWKNGETGYPIVDAGMRELNQTGYMHNRVRMIVASFLTKHLLIDWRWGEAYFAEKLLDFELASNNGGWQWAAGCGVDAALYFRVFNPYLQTERFDPELKYINHWVKNLNTFEYPKPIVEHTFARNRVLNHYKKYLKEF